MIVSFRKLLCLFLCLPEGLVQCVPVAQSVNAHPRNTLTPMYRTVVKLSEVGKVIQVYRQYKRLLAQLSTYNTLNVLTIFFFHALRPDFIRSRAFVLLFVSLLQTFCSVAFTPNRNMSLSLYVHGCPRWFSFGMSLFAEAMYCSHHTSFTASLWSLSKVYWMRHEPRASTITARV